MSSQLSIKEIKRTPHLLMIKTMILFLFHFLPIYNLCKHHFLCCSPYSQTYLKTINNQMSAIMNYAVKYYKLRSNPRLAAGAIGKSSADEMNIWTREQFDYFLTFEKKVHTGWRSASCFMVGFDLQRFWPLPRQISCRTAPYPLIRTLW